MVDWIYYQVQYATPWVPGTHKAMRATGMQSAVRGVSNAGTPGLVRASLAVLPWGSEPPTFPRAAGECCRFVGRGGAGEERVRVDFLEAVRQVFVRRGEAAEALGHIEAGLRALPASDIAGAKDAQRLLVRARRRLGGL